MKRRHIHTGFTLAIAILLLLAANNWLDLQQRNKINNSVLAVPSQLSAQEYKDTVKGSDEPAVKLAQASALMNGSEFELGEELLSTLAQSEDNAAASQIAQFNLANGYLREAQRTVNAPGRKRALIELAKQRYRDLLKEQPQHWDARHNLEIALRLAPEKGAFDIDDRGKPIKSVGVIFPGFKDRDLP